MASAVPLFNGLKHLACPKEAGGARCTTSGCLFGHAADKQPQQQQPKPQPQSLDGAVDGGDDANEPPAKRQKISTIQSSDLYDPFSPPLAQPQQQSQQPTQQPPKALTQPPAKDDSLIQPSTPIKPPPSAATTSVAQNSPLFKPTPTPSRKTATPTVASPATSTVSAASPSAPSPAAPAAVVERKPETLNPRLLMPAPAAHGVRYKLLSFLHSEFARLNTEVSNQSIKDPSLKKLLMSDQELIWMALDREQEVATTRRAIYTNIMKQDVMKYKRMTLDPWVAECTIALQRKTAPKAKNPSIGPPIEIKTGLEPDQEAVVLKRLVTPINGLERHGYVSTVPTDDEIKEAQAAVDLSAGWEKCDRCTARFQVFPGRNIETGELASGGKCTHHPGRPYFTERPQGDISLVPKKYRCCEEDVGESPGCTIGTNHVWKTNDHKRLASLWNFVETPPNDKATHKAVAFDCEMGYTVQGMELVRVTATSWPDGAALLDVLVRPFGEVLDLNSKYSGVFPEDLANAIPWSSDWKAPTQKEGERRILPIVASPELARDLLFSRINPDTILIGHGLENDLNAMRMVHPRIIDTVLLYPHKRGLPIRMGLKALMQYNLNRRIQVDTGEGHDSAEDARAAGDLVRLKLQKEWASMQSDGWKLVEGVFRQPGWKPEPAQRTSEDSTDPDEGGVKLIEDSRLL